MTAIDPVRLAELDRIRLVRSQDEGMSVMRAVAYVTGEPTERPRSICPVLEGFLQHFSDCATDSARQLLKPLIPKLVGTWTEPGLAGYSARSRRAWLLIDFAIRVALPEALDAIGCNAQAKNLRSLPGVPHRQTAKDALKFLNDCPTYDHNPAVIRSIRWVVLAVVDATEGYIFAAGTAAASAATDAIVFAAERDPDAWERTTKSLVQVIENAVQR